MKKLIIITLVVFAIAAIVFLGYYLRLQKESSTLPATARSGNLPTVQLPKTTGNAQGAGQTTAPVENLKLAANISAIDYFVDAKNTVTVVQPDGQILKTGGDKPEVLSASVVKNVVRASFSFDGKKILVVMGGPSKNQASVFDVEQKTWQPFPQNASGLTWSPNNYQIAYFSNTPGGGVLSLLDAGNPAAKPKALLSLRQEDMTLNWLAPNRLLIADKTSAVWSSSLWSFDLAKKIVSPVIQDQPGLETVWGHSSTPFGLMFSANQNQQGGKLQLVDASGNPLKQLSFLTLPSKCVFYDKPVVAASAQRASSTAATTSASASRESQKTRLALICAVPRDQQALNINTLPDAYQEKALFTSDDFFEINVDDGGVKTVFNDSAKYLDASDIKIFNESLFFINRFDKKVYSVPLG